MVVGYEIVIRARQAVRLMSRSSSRPDVSGRTMTGVRPIAPMVFTQSHTGSEMSTRQMEYVSAASLYQVIVES